MPGNPRRGRPQGKCHRKQTAPASARVRVKGWGKSPPRLRQRRRHGKPHREQNRIGTARTRTPVRFRPVSRPAVRVGCTRRPVTGAQDEWLSRPRLRPRAIQNPAYRPAGFIIFQSFVSGGPTRARRHKPRSETAPHGRSRYGQGCRLCHKGYLSPGYVYGMRASWMVIPGTPKARPGIGEPRWSSQVFGPTPGPVPLRSRISAALRPGR